MDDSLLCKKMLLVTSTSKVRIQLPQQGLLIWHRVFRSNWTIEVRLVLHCYTSLGLKPILTESCTCILCAFATIKALGTGSVGA